MKKYILIKLRRLLLSSIINPIFVIVYCISFYELYTLCRFGRTDNNIYILLACMLFYLVWFIILIIKAIRKPINVPSKVKGNHLYKTIWTYAAIIIIAGTTLFSGVKIYESGVKYNGKLSWALQDFFHKKTIKLQHNNIYESGIDGIFQDIKKRVNMPEKLYVATSFSLNFDSNGTITSFDTLLYGKNSIGLLKSYLISYDNRKSNEIIINLDGYVNEDYNEEKLVDPFINTMKVLPIKDSIENWNEEHFGILYYGKRSFGYNTDGIRYIDAEGNVNAATNASLELIGYAVSLYVPEKEKTYMPYRYILKEDLGNIKLEEPLKNKKEEVEKEEVAKKSSNDTDQFYLSDEVGYRLEVLDAAMGKRSYSLNETKNGGSSWSVINWDPFLGDMGVAAGVTFINDKVGFVCLSHSGGMMAELYGTQDGGTSFEKIALPPIKVTLSGLESYNPFDFPGMPYEKEGSLNVLVGQGSDGDYNGGCKALYESKDSGKTWSYIKEANN